MRSAAAGPLSEGSAAVAFLQPRLTCSGARADAEYHFVGRGGTPREWGPPIG